MTLEAAKARLDPAQGESSGYISPSDMSTAFDDLEDAWQTDDAVVSAAAAAAQTAADGAQAAADAAQSDATEALAGIAQRVAYYVDAEWQDRPTGLPAYVQVEWRSVLDDDAPPPSGATAGDTWKRAPGATF